ncbi:MAG: dienelactone hydrolase family protein [Rhodospirillales bacterium]
MAFLACAVAAWSAVAAAAERQRVSFDSVTVDRLSIILDGSVRNAARVTIEAELTLPDGNGRVPAMVVAHGSGGVGRREADWSQVLSEAGLAAFAFDSFTPRGVRETATGQDRLPTWNNVLDALAALRFLAVHPRIDPDRIGVMGFSRGGSVALLTTFEPVRAAVVPATLRFAAHVALYPPCNLRYHAPPITGAPIAFLLAESDDYTPIAFCDGYIDWFRARGADVTVRVYPGAYHGFDGPAAPRWRADIDSFAACDVGFDIPTWTMQHQFGREPMTPRAQRIYFESCRRRGATVGGDAAATRQARADVLGFLRAHGVAPP